MDRSNFFYTAVDYARRNDNLWRFKTNLDNPQTNDTVDLLCCKVVEFNVYLFYLLDTLT